MLTCLIKYKLGGIKESINQESRIKNQEFISHKTSYNYLQANNSIQMNNTNKETCESKNRRGMGRR